jgi:predicted nucleic acid-binding protein
MRVMIDSNILDHLDEDDEARDELINRPDILLLVTPAQEREVAAISEKAKRERLQAMMTRLCRRLALPSSPLQLAVEASAGEKAGSTDDSIIAAAIAAGCDLLVSEDIEVLNKALAAGTRAMDWRLFLERVVWAPRRRHK